MLKILDGYVKRHVHNILDMILMYDREAKYDPTLEETSDELLRLFLDEN
ncbi:hypothetical protein ACT7DH_06480 [Bacillus pacificus]